VAFIEKNRVFILFPQLVLYRSLLVLHSGMTLTFLNFFSPFTLHSSILFVGVYINVFPISFRLLYLVFCPLCEGNTLVETGRIYTLQGQTWAGTTNENGQVDEEQGLNEVRIGILYLQDMGGNFTRGYSS